VSDVSDDAFVKHLIIIIKVPGGPNPKLEEGDKAPPPKSVVPEWRVGNSAYWAKTSSGEEAAKHLKAFRGLFKEVAAAAKTRLRVDKSAI